MDYAVLGRSMPTEADPLRAQRRSLLAGCACAVAIGVVTVGLAVLRPVAGDAPLVMSRQSGELFVRVGDDLRPVANLASAYLVLGHPAAPRLLDGAGLESVPRGPVLGIPGAPRSIGAVMAADPRWTVCDDRDGATTVTVAGPDEPPEIPADRAVLVSASDGSPYLLYDGWRAAVDPHDRVIARTLHLDGVTPRPVSTSLLNAIPEVSAIGAPRIPGAGEPSGVAGFPIGAVLRTARAGFDEYYVVLREGLQRVGRLAADLVRFVYPEGDAEVVSVAPDLVASSGVTDTLPVATYPSDAPALIEAAAELCATWRSGQVDIAAGDGRPARRGSVTLAIADGNGPNIDAVRIPAGRSVDVTAAMLTTDTGTSGRYLITDAGIRFPLRDSATATALGLTAAPVQVPWAIIAALPAGPELSRDAASVSRDVVVPSSP
jgi:type VII secretion protein EccB